jgi:hypothetical protein
VALEVLAGHEGAARADQVDEVVLNPILTFVSHVLPRCVNSKNCKVLPN